MNFHISEHELSPVVVGSYASQVSEHYVSVLDLTFFLNAECDFIREANCGTHDENVWHMLCCLLGLISSKLHFLKKIDTVLLAGFFPSR